MAIRSTKLTLPAFKIKVPVEAPSPAGTLKAADCAGASPRSPPADVINLPKEKEKPLAATHKNSVFVAAIKMRKILRKRFPRCFMGFKQPKQPLKIGIDLLVMRAAPDLSPRKILYAIEDYTGGTRYLAALIEGAARIDLDGNEAGVVTAADEEYAQRRLKKRARVSSKLEEARHD